MIMMLYWEIGFMGSGSVAIFFFLFAYTPVSDRDIAFDLSFILFFALGKSFLPILRFLQRWRLKYRTALLLPCFLAPTYTGELLAPNI